MAVALPQPGSRRSLRYATVVLVGLAVAGMIWVLGPRLASPPRTITLATGPAGGAYAELGPRYRKVLERNGVTLRLLTTAGDVENLAKLRDGKSGISAAFVQPITATDEERAGLASLGTLMYSPLWVFARGDHELALRDLTGKRLSIGPEGSGTRFQVLKVLALVGLDPKSLTLLAYTPAEAEAALLRGDLEGLAISASWDAPSVRRLLADPRARLIGFPRADAYVALNPYLSKLVVPMGVGDLARNLPQSDVTLLASKTSLLVREDLHPALQYLLLEAASEIHGGPALFRRAGEFPAGEQMDVPLSPEARQFYKSGAPFLQRYFPFWLAVLIQQLLILLIPVVGLLYPALRALPGVYYGAMEQRLLALYRELKLLEGEADRAAEADRAGLVDRIDELGERANRLRLPVRFAQSLYHLKLHIRFVRDRLARVSEVPRPVP